MKLSFNNYDLLLLADWLEEFGSSYDIVKANAIRNNKYNLNLKSNCKNKIYNEHNYGGGMASGAVKYGNGRGLNYFTDGRIGSWGDGHGWGEKYRNYEEYASDYQ